MEPLTLATEPVVEQDATDESTCFYRGMAEELSSLSRLSAEIQWAPDVPLRAKRTPGTPPRVASTGRLPGPEPRSVRRVPERPREKDPPPVARNVAEVSMVTKRPPHLAVPRPRTQAARRGTTQAPQGRLGRRLQLGGMAEELSGLAHAHAEIQHAPDVPLRAKRTPATPPRVASTGRLPGPEPRSVRRVPERPREKDPPPVARNVAEVSMVTKRPPHLAVPRPRTQAARRGTTQAPQGRLGRRLQLGAKIRAAKPWRESAGAEAQLSHRAERIGEAPVVAEPVAVPAMAATEPTSRPMSVRQDPLSPRAESCGHFPPNDGFEAMVDGPPILVAPRPQVQLLEVMDLQLFVPRSGTSPEVNQVNDEGMGQKARPPDVLEKECPSPRQRLEPSPRAVKVSADQRPLRGLILDVIDEMSKPPAYQEPAEVVGGSELAPLFAPKARQRPPLDEDAYGRRVGRLPPPYEVGPPPPYDGPGPAVNEAEEQLRNKLLKKQEELESREKALAASQAEAQAQVKQLADLQQKAQEQSLALAQAQATLQAQVHSQREETNHLIQTVQQHSEAAQRSLAETAQRGLQEMQEQLSAGLAPGDGSSELHQRLQRLEALLEGRFSETLKAMTSQSEERAAYVAALADQRSAPMQMLPLCIPQPAPAAPPQPPKVSVAAQTNQEDNRKEHEARVARFTHYLLHGPPGATTPMEPRVTMRDTHAEAKLALSLRDSLKREMSKDKAFMSSSAASSSDSVNLTFAADLQASPGEFVDKVASTGSSPGQVTLSVPFPGSRPPGPLPASPGECESEAPGQFSGSEGEVCGFNGASSGEVSQGELEAKEDSDADPSSGEVSSFT